MGVHFLTPLAALVGLAALLPLAAFALVERRGRHIRALLAVPEPRLRRGLVVVAALALLPAAVALAAAQPVVARNRVLHERVDAQAFVVVDTSRSMLASAGRGSTTRITRAKRLALRLRDRLPGIPVGIASLTDRLLPHLMPTSDEAVFRAALEQSVGIDRPPASSTFAGRATTYDALAAAATTGFFPPAARRRLLVVLTDGESRQLSPGLATALARAPRIVPLFVHVWKPDERIFAPDGLPEPSYSADPASRAELVRLAAAAHGRVFAESDLGGAVDAARTLLGRGGSRTRVERRERVALAPFALVLGAAPLALLLWRRNGVQG